MSDADKQKAGYRQNLVLITDRQISSPAVNSQPIDNCAKSTGQAQVFFNRQELNQILRIYGFKVASGEWLDYAIDHLDDRAVFSVFRKASEVPMFRIEKIPKLARKQGAYRVVTITGLVLKRGGDLGQVLRVFEKKPKFKVL